jgi:hypothetical protein
MRRKHLLDAGKAAWRHTFLQRAGDQRDLAAITARVFQRGACCRCERRWP